MESDAPSDLARTLFCERSKNAPLIEFTHICPTFFCYWDLMLFLCCYSTPFFLETRNYLTFLTFNSQNVTLKPLTKLLHKMNITKRSRKRTPSLMTVDKLFCFQLHMVIWSWSSARLSNWVFAKNSAGLFC